VNVQVAERLVLYPAAPDAGPLAMTVDTLMRCASTLKMSDQMKEVGVEDGLDFIGNEVIQLQKLHVGMQARSIQLVY